MFDDNSALVQRINHTASTTFSIPVVAKDLNTEAACTYIRGHPGHFGCFIHADVDAVVDFGNEVIVVVVVVVVVVVRMMIHFPKPHSNICRRPRKDHLWQHVHAAARLRWIPLLQPPPLSRFRW
jgi:hypothetical protein